MAAFVERRGSERLLFAFLVLRVRLAPLAELLKFDFALDKLPVLARPIVRAGALRAGQLYQLILGHCGAL